MKRSTTFLQKTSTSSCTTNRNIKRESTSVCSVCNECFSPERFLENHDNNCLKINGKQAINIPKKGENILKFNNFLKQLPVPFVIYADFEAYITEKVQQAKLTEEMDKRSYTKAYQTHEDCGCRYKVVRCYDDKYSKPIQTYRGENSWKICLKRSNTANLLLRKVSTNHWL